MGLLGIVHLAQLSNMGAAGMQTAAVHVIRELRAPFLRPPGGTPSAGLDVEVFVNLFNTVAVVNDDAAADWQRTEMLLRGGPSAVSQDCRRLWQHQGVEQWHSACIS